MSDAKTTLQHMRVDDLIDLMPDRLAAAQEMFSLREALEAITGVGWHQGRAAARLASEVLEGHRHRLLGHAAGRYP